MAITTDKSTAQAKPLKTPKIGVFIVAYNAEKTITQVLDRIPKATWERISEVFIFDDSSPDTTAEVALHHKNEAQREKVKVFKNQVNLQYGGNQKRGFLYAIEHDFDVVVLLHGDGQYAPEVMDRLIDPVAFDEADAVFGSRMLESGQALKGGMPLYKFVGNKILTGIENFILKTRLSEFHSGYRVYNVHALKQIPFINNSNDFHFDNEIIVQLLDANLRIKEVPIPTYYGDEICRVNGIKYAWNVVLTAFRYRLHKLGVYYDKSFDRKAGHQYSYKPNKYSSHSQILEMVERASAGKTWDVLDVGCAQGFLAKRVADMGHRVVGIDVYDSAEAKQACDEFHVVDLDRDGLVFEKGRTFDCIVFADVLEHCREPEKILIDARRYLKPGGVIIASTGNVAHWYIRLMLLCGRFTYTDRGILDRTHVRLFTQSSFKDILRDTGFTVTEQRSTPIPFDLLTGWKLLSDACCLLNMLAANLWSSLFAYQIILKAHKDPEATELLRHHEIHRPDFKEYQPSKSVEKNRHNDTMRN